MEANGMRRNHCESLRLLVEANSLSIYQYEVSVGAYFLLVSSP